MFLGQLPSPNIYIHCTPNHLHNVIVFTYLNMSKFHIRIYGRFCEERDFFFQPLRHVFVVEEVHDIIEYSLSRDNCNTRMMNVTTEIINKYLKNIISLEKNLLKLCTVCISSDSSIVNTMAKLWFC